MGVMHAVPSPASLLDRALGFVTRHPVVTDSAVAVLLGVLGLPSWPGASLASAPQAVYGFVVIGCCVALLVRRLYPRASLAVIAVLLVLHVVAVDDVSAFAGLVCLIAAFTTQTRLEPPWRWIFLALLYAGVAAAVLLGNGPVLGPDRSWEYRINTALSACLALTVAVLIGAIRRRNRQRVEDALERTRTLEARWAAERRLAAAEERGRIAREMHDILGHSLNVVAAQAEGARSVLRTDPDRADEALANIGRLSRSAVDEVRGVIDVLRDGAPSTAARRPPPGLAEVSGLVADLRSAGADIRLRIDGDPRVVPGRVGSAGYRIVQESLTNAAAHAPGASVLAQAGIEPDALTLLIVNRPADPVRASSRPSRDQLGDTVTGHGLVGIHERARALGGTAETGPDPVTGGWRVAARLPWSRS